MTPEMLSDVVAALDLFFWSGAGFGAVVVLVLSAVLFVFTRTKAA